MVAVSLPPMNTESQRLQALDDTTKALPKRRTNQRDIEDRKNQDDDEPKSDSEYQEEHASDNDGGTESLGEDSDEDSNFAENKRNTRARKAGVNNGKTK